MFPIPLPVNPLADDRAAKQVKFIPMAKLNGMCVVTVSIFTGGANLGISKKNGLQAVILSPVCGKIPSKRVLAGSIAQSGGFDINGTFLVSYTERDEQEFMNAAGDTLKGRDFQYVNAGPCGVMEALQAKQVLGDAMIIDIPAAEVIKLAVVTPSTDANPVDPRELVTGTLVQNDLTPVQNDLTPVGQ